MKNKNLIILYDYLQNIIYNSDCDQLSISSLDGEYQELGESLIFLHNCIKEQKQLGCDICNGNLRHKVAATNVLAAPFKDIDERLSHLNWLMGQVADGDFKQRLQNMGELSSSFNNMVDKLLHMARHDDITGLPNRLYFFETTRQMLDNNKDKHYFLARWDLNGFKIFNDMFGSEIGTALLKYVAEFVKSYFKDDCTTCRYESDHFIVCFPEENYPITDVIYVLRHCFKGFDADFRYKASIGIYKITDLSLNVKVMCDRALMAQQSIKTNSKINYAFYDEKFRSKLLEEQSIINKMRNALENNEFEMFLQPQYSTESYEIIGAEALVRWKNADGTYVLPTEFINIFEKNGSIVRIDKFIWEEACKQLASQIKTYGIENIIPISINVSRIDLLKNNILDILDELIKKYQLDKRMLHLEITESAYVDAEDSLLPIIAQLKQSGYILEMDDFGSGYSSLSTLKDVDVDVIKLDLKFLNDKKNKERGNNILSSVVRMAKWLSLDIVAEGVETVEQFEFLKSIGCEKVQGFYFAKPMDVASYNKLIAKRSFNRPVKYYESNNKQHFVGVDELLYHQTRNSVEKLNDIKNKNVAIVEYTNGNLEVVFINDAFLNALAITRQDYQKYQYSIIHRINALDRANYVAMYQRAIMSQKEEECVAHSNALKTGEVMAIKTKCKLVAKNGDSFLFNIEMETVSSENDYEALLIENAELRSQLQMHANAINDDNIFKLLLLESHTIIFSYDVASDQATYSFPENNGERKYEFIENYITFAVVNRKLIHSDCIGMYLSKLKNATKKDIQSSFEFRGKLLHNVYNWYRIHYKSVLDANGKIVKVVGRLYSIQTEKNAQNALCKLTTKDALTGIDNRIAIENAVNDTIKDNYEHKCYAFYVFDIDYFKIYNDTYGHLTGDKVLRAVAKRVKDILEINDLFGRVGGDEFVIMRETHCEDGIEPIISFADKLKLAVGSVHNKLKLDKELTISIGIAGCAYAKLDFNELYANADKALYEAKADGRNTYKIF